MPVYNYSGPVSRYGKPLTLLWQGETTARNESEARSHLAYKFKTQHNLVPNAKIELPGKIFERR